MLFQEAKKSGLGGNFSAGGRWRGGKAKKSGIEGNISAGFAHGAVDSYNYPLELCPDVSHFGGYMNFQKPSWDMNLTTMFGPGVWTSGCFLGVWMDAEGNFVNVCSTDAFDVSLLATIARPNLPERHLRLEKDAATDKWRCGHSTLDTTQSTLDCIMWVSGTGMVSVWRRPYDWDVFTPSGWSEPAKVQMTSAMPPQRRLSSSTVDTCLEANIDNESQELGKRAAALSETASSSDAEYSARRIQCTTDDKAAKLPSA